MKNSPERNIAETQKSQNFKIFINLLLKRRSHNSREQIKTMLKGFKKTSNIFVRSINATTVKNPQWQ